MFHARTNVLDRGIIGSRSTLIITTLIICVQSRSGTPKILVFLRQTLRFWSATCPWRRHLVDCFSAKWQITPASIEFACIRWVCLQSGYVPSWSPWQQITEDWLLTLQPSVFLKHALCSWFRWSPMTSLAQKKCLTRWGVPSQLWRFRCFLDHLLQVRDCDNIFNLN